MLQDASCNIVYPFQNCTNNDKVESVTLVIIVLRVYGQSPKKGQREARTIYK